MIFLISPKFFSEFHRTSVGRASASPDAVSAIANKGDDAKGIYINYLQVGNTVIYPVYGIWEDALAHKVFSRYFGRNAISIRASSCQRRRRIELY